MIADIETLASKAKENIAGLFQILGDAGTTERSHLIQLRTSAHKKEQKEPQNPPPDKKKAGNIS